MHESLKDVKPSIIIKSVLGLLHEPGEIFEVRIPKTKAGTVSGYFNDTTIAAALIAKESGKHQAIYATVNPITPALLARNENRLTVSQTTTTDSEIARRRWFLLDLDPVRPAGISSTDSEVLESQARAETIIDWLSSIGWPEPIQACSGNGWHVMYRVDEPNDDETRINFEMALKMLSSIFSDPRVAVDVTVFNASRVWKVYGTLSAKGSSTTDRPHRIAYLAKLPKEMICVTTDQIDNVARPLRDAKSEEYKDMAGEYITDMVKFLTDRGITVTSNAPRPMFGNEGQKWIISRCPFDHNHKDPMVGLANNRPVFRCLHNSCSAYRWKEFREKIDPNFKDPDTVYKRLKEWCDGTAAEVDPELLQTACQLSKKLDSVIKSLRKDCSRPRINQLESFIKAAQREFRRDTLGDNNEKGNIVGLINRTRTYQSEGIVPMYWIADYDHRIRCGQVGDIECPKLSEQDEISLLVKFHSAGDAWVKQTHTSQVIKHLAAEYRINPLRTFLKAKRWDGTKRLDSWLPFYMATKDDDYTRAIGRKWLISAVARAMDPGCQADHMLIFEGAQGIGKSRAVRILGGQFYTEYSGSVKSGIGGKDMVHVIIGKMIVEMSELAAIRRADMESLKAMLTTCVDDARLSYERDAKAYPRTCVFIGTTNAQGQSYIIDQTGARRFWPTLVGETGKVKLQLLEQDADQLWAEAVEAYEEGEDWYTVPTDAVLEEQADRQVHLEDSDPWYGKIRSALQDSAYYESGAFTAVDEYIDGKRTPGFVVRAGPINVILGAVLGIDTARQSSNDVNRVQNIMRAIGFLKNRPTKKWPGGTYCYDLSRGPVGTIWSAITAAKDEVKFPKPASMERSDG
jgi:hypothetical protein